jgi:hypothetical protein
LFIELRKEEKEWEQGLYHPGVAQAIAEPRKPLKSCVTPPKAGNLRRSRVTKTLCMAGKRFDLAARHAIDHRQPYRWARFAGDASHRRT